MDLVAGLEIFLAVGLLVAALISYVWEKVRMEITSLALLLSVLVILWARIAKMADSWRSDESILE